jgi:hypothetical protein
MEFAVLFIAKWFLKFRWALEVLKNEVFKRWKPRYPLENSVRSLFAYYAYMYILERLLPKIDVVESNAFTRRDAIIIGSNGFNTYYYDFGVGSSCAGREESISLGANSTWVEEHIGVGGLALGVYS